MERLNIDFETRSEIDLRMVGVYRYAEDPSTDLMCAAYSFDDEDDVQLWVPGAPVPARITQHIEEGGDIRAWNANFERVLWWLILCQRYDWPKPTREQFFCTMCDALAMALPAALGQATKAVNLPFDKQKDMDGRKLVLKMCKPRSTKGGEVVWWDDDDHMQRLYEYCRQDVIAERAMYHRTRRLIPHEREVYLLDQKMNDRGVLIDVELVEGAQKIVKVGRTRANTMIRELTEGAVTSVTQYAKLKGWLHENDHTVPDATKPTVRDLLADKGVQGPVRRVLEIWADSALASLSKLETMLRSRNHDDVSRGLQQYHGASTGRWAGRLIQPHNFPRDTIDDPERFIPDVRAGNIAAIEEHEPPLIVVSNLLRRCIRARPGRRLLAVDYSQIEIRVLAWIAGEEGLVEAFRGEKKIYENMAARIFNVAVDDVTESQRTVGKTAVLGCGYQMAGKKFSKQLYENTGIFLEARDGYKDPPEEADHVVIAYRDTFQRIVEYWKRINAAAMLAVRDRGRITYAGHVRFVYRGKFLWCVLPSGRPLAYCRPEISPSRTEDGTYYPEAIHYSELNSITRQWVRTTTYGGRLTENVVQAMARDLMASGMMRVEQAGYPVVLTVHDEVVADVPNEHGSLDEYVNLMRETPRWARTCPIAVEGWEGARYRK